MSYGIKTKPGWGLLANSAREIFTLPTLLGYAYTLTPEGACMALAAVLWDCDCADTNQLKREYRRVKRRELMSLC